MAGDSTAWIDRLIGPVSCARGSASEEALGRAHVAPHQVDMLILCTMTPHLQLPATSAMVASELGTCCGSQIPPWVGPGR
jgi:hypothetical protein